MGTWGTKLFDDDTASDVRDEYVRLLSEGHSGSAATDWMLDRWKDTLDDGDDGPVFWLALAVTQHKHGRLESRVNERALSVLDGERGLDRWREIGTHAVRGRLKVYGQIRVLLQSPQPREKRVAPPFRDSCEWEAGEVIGYRLKSEQLVLLGVLGTEEHAKGVSPVCEVLDWRGRNQPTAAEIAKAGIRRGTLAPETLLYALAATYPGYEANPTATRQNMLVEMGLIERPKEDTGLLLGLTEVIHRLKTGNRKARETVEAFARERKPALLEPVTQVSLRRELKKSEMPAKRIERLRIRRPAVTPLGEWLVIRWFELDDALGDVFGVS